MGRFLVHTWVNAEPVPRFYPNVVTLTTGEADIVEQRQAVRILQKSNLPGFNYYNSGGTATDIPANLLKQSNYTVSADMLNATMKFTLCSPTATMNIQAAFAFTGGNPFCVTLHNP